MKKFFVVCQYIAAILAANAIISKILFNTFGTLALLALAVAVFAVAKIAHHIECKRDAERAEYEN